MRAAAESDEPPGRGHRCASGLSGDTPLLMADGRTKPLRAVRPGERVVGTRHARRYRCYVTTTVLQHRSASQPGYHVALSDGTEIVAGADQRLLTRRGWKHVTAGGGGGPPRPRLTPNDLVLGTGRFAAPPKETAVYQRGYLCGVVRGGGLRAAAGEALERSHRYLSEQRLAVAAIRELVALPAVATDEWSKGFLAGILDAEGRAGRALAVASGDPEVVGQVGAAFRRLGFRHVVEPPTPSGRRTIRLRGGLRERLRLLHTVEPASLREATIGGRTVKSPAPLRVVAVQPLGLELALHAVTTATGDFVADGLVSRDGCARPPPRAPTTKSV